mmetsp:Transcript_31648/g.89902  ORF Transcript_31648/g.89902 Transcript_31648/m.89902 type:complete len:412 (+) Transcript_31648:2519-3754(+)
MLLRQKLEGAILLAVELNEDDVPDLQHVGVVHVDQARGVAAADAVVVNLRARAAWALVTHLPEVVLAVKRQNAGLREVLEPDGLGFEVRLKALLGIAAKVCSIQAGWLHLEHVGEELPGPADGFLFEVVAKAPVAKHLEEGVVVHVLANVIQVVVLAAGTDALLGVGGALQLGEVRCGVRSPQEDGLELVHAGIGEQQRGVVVGHHRGGGPEGVLLGAKEVDEGLTNKPGGPLAREAALGAAAPFLRGSHHVVASGHGHHSLRRGGLPLKGLLHLGKVVHACQVGCGLGVLPQHSSVDNHGVEREEAGAGDNVPEGGVLPSQALVIGELGLKLLQQGGELFCSGAETGAGDRLADQGAHVVHRHGIHGPAPIQNLAILLGSQQGSGSHSLHHVDGVEDDVAGIHQGRKLAL